MNMPLISPLMTNIIIGAVLFFAGAGIGIFAIRHRFSRKWKLAMLIPSAVFILYILFYLACNFVGRMQVKAQFSKMRSLGIETDVDKIIPKNRKSPKNGALFYEAAYKIETGTADCGKVIDIADKTSYDITLLDGKEKSIVGSFLTAENAGMIFSLLKEGTKKPFAAYDYYYDGINTLLPSLSRQRTIFRLLSLKASHDAFSGKNAEAYDVVNDGFKMLKQLENEMFLISHLVNMACYTINCNRLNDLLEKYEISNADASKLLDVLNAADLKKGATKALEGDINCFGTDAFERAIKGEPVFEFISFKNQRQIFFINYYPFFYQDYAYYLNYMTKLADLVKEPYWTVKEKIQDMESGLKHKHFIPISKMYTASLGPIVLKTAQCETNINAVKIALALHIYKNNHGQFPEKLDVLAPEILKEVPVDFTNGKPFEYKKTNKYFSLSSEWLAEKAKRKH